MKRKQKMMPFYFSSYVLYSCVVEIKPYIHGIERVGALGNGPDQKLVYEH